MWWAFYLFTLAAGLPPLNWALLGPAFLTLLFVLPHASLDVTEMLSSRKYPQYAAYQRRVSRFFPLPPRADAPLAPMQLRDAALVAWFVLGTGIAFLIDMEVVLIENPATYGQPGTARPAWPPEPCVRAMHWWGRLADPLVLARPVWFQVGIWLEIVVQAPFYVVAIYAFRRQRNWIRLPSMLYATVLLTIMPIVLAEEFAGQHKTPRPLLVAAVYGPYVLMPLLLLARVWSPEVFPPVEPSPNGPAPPNGSGRRAKSPSKNGAKALH